ncbi:MAG: NAD-dependent epimerase/dehydratase family protein, partial [Bacteroidetes bacterium]|nr:NAD-dependent epimerase/dehydratase family protein [Bacteroidota bacterium]
GVTGMVGEGVLHEALNHPEVQEVLIINRRPSGVVHSKLKEIIHENFFDLSEVKNQLTGYDACYFCLGVSAVKLNEEKYTQYTYDLTLSFAKTLLEVSPNITFIYVSGSGTDSTEKGRQMWARVKGKTENDLLKLPFKRAYMFRPGFMKPTPGLKNTLSFYKLLSMYLR